jgi:AraC-like DNA-binding protein
MLDERNNVSYPDVKETADGYIYVAYDRERGCFRRTLSQACADAREILFAKITEEDIMAGQIVSEGSRLRCVASKLGRYADEGDNPFGEIDRYSENDLVKLLLPKDSMEIPALLFDQYDINCRNMHKLDREQLDDLISSLEAKNGDKERIIRRLVTLIRSVSAENVGGPPVVVSIKNAIRDHLSEDPSTADIAEAVCISRYYMCHLFKKETGITVVDYKNELKLTRSKEMLICTDDKIADIAYACGFGSASYFSKIFSETEHLSPSQYRSLHKK